jgi:hypothetical protein
MEPSSRVEAFCSDAAQALRLCIPATCLPGVVVNTGILFAHLERVRAVLTSMDDPREFRSDRT